MHALAVPAVEPMIAASVLVLGLLVAVQKRMPWGVAAVVAGVFAFFHGAAHGAELASDSVIASLAALAGMALIVATGVWMATRRRLKVEPIED